MAEARRSLSDGLDRFATAALLASVVAIPITRSIDLPIVGPRLTIFEVVAFPMILAWLAARTVSRSWRTVSVSRRLDGALAAYWVVAAMSGVTAYRILGQKALLPFSTEMAVLSYLLLFFLATRDLLVRRHAMSLLFDAWSVSTIVVGLVGLVGLGEMLRCAVPLSGLVYGSGRLLSTFRNPNQVAAYMVPTVMLFSALWASRPATPLHRLVVPAAVLSVTVMYFAASRGGAVAAAFGWLCLVALPRWPPLVRVVGALMLFVLVLAGASLVLKSSGNSCFAYVSNTLTTMTIQLPTSIRLAQGIASQADEATVAEGQTIPIGSDTATSFAFRKVMARMAFNFARQHPLTGVGVGTMHVHVQESTLTHADVDAHNMAMTLLAETGFLGLALFAWSLGWFAWMSLVAFRRTTDPQLRALRVGLLVALLAYLVMTLSFDGQRQRVLWTLLAVIYASLHDGVLGVGGVPVTASDRTAGSAVSVPETLAV